MYVWYDKWKIPASAKPLVLDFLLQLKSTIGLYDTFHTPDLRSTFIPGTWLWSLQLQIYICTKTFVSFFIFAEFFTTNIALGYTSQELVSFVLVFSIIFTSVLIYGIIMFCLWSKNFSFSEIFSPPSKKSYSNHYACLLTIFQQLLVFYMQTF